jgi:thiol-disulfide isomerase/thioredoxin
MTIFRKMRLWNSIRVKTVFNVLFLFIIVLFYQSAIGQHNANINFRWSNLDTTIQRISIGNSSDFWWTDPMPIKQFTAIRTLDVEKEEWKVNLVTPIQQVYISIIGKTFKLLLANDDCIELKIHWHNEDKSMKIDINGIAKKRVLLLDTLDKYLETIGFSSKGKTQKSKNELLAYLDDTELKAKTFVQNYLTNENAALYNLAYHYIEAQILNKKYYISETLIMPDWIFLNDTTSIYKQLSPVKELLKNYGNFLSINYNTNKDDSILIQKTNNLKKYYRDYSLIVAIEKILSENSKSISKEHAELLLGDIEDSTHQIFTSKMLARNFMIGKPIPDSVGNQTYLIPFNNKSPISFSKMLTNNNDSMVIVDFWASWCGACRLDMQDAIATKKYLDSLKIKVVYLSCDREKDYEKWIKASKIEGVTNNQFLIKGDFSSPLIKYLNVNYIPRYILFKNGKLMNIVFPRLTDQSLNDVRKEIEKVMKEAG